jgi:hypothetical protein
MAETQVPVNRTLVGVLSLVCVIAGGVIGWVDSIENVWCGSFVRVGLLLGAFWVALPGRNREAAWANVSPWTLVIALGTAVVFVRRPRIFFAILVLVVIAAFVIRPRPRRR